MLQGPAAGEGTGSLRIEGVRYDGASHLAVTGRADAKSRIMVYLDDKLVGRARADDDGKWHVGPKLALAGVRS